MEERTHGIVLRKVRYNDTGMIVDIFTASRGTVSFLAKTGKGSRLRAPLLTPLAIVDIRFRWRQQRPLQLLDDVQTAMPYTALGMDPVRTSVALFLQEFLYHTLKNEVANEALFDYVTQSMRILDEATDGLANFHLAFMIRLTHYLGLWPRTENWQRGCMLDLKEGVMTCHTPEHRFWVSAEDTSRIPILARMTFSNMRYFRMNRAQRNTILEGLITYYRLHVPEFPELRSVEILREIFA
ncbi:MAG: DNA repair protein RecO [Bacteroidaceae bacterium]|nr:DNA repair protein RecO [Bacteroidaceae bacterium]MDD5970668.1 DNA repair protein RecO [Paraprevotella sp.]MDD6125599.1 DNA repair protein RecO [Paraprevotella sp.]MDD6607916.1 DNA repair protein RecO [Paraprevotella sp.]MDD6759604.1 DNA repair protein RecO [Paraprevotella sp.]